MLFQFNPNLIYVSCDSGKSGSKFSWLNSNHQIESDVFGTLSEPIKASDATFQGGGVSNLLEVGNNKFLVGGTGNYNLDNDHSKLGETHEHCVLTSIAKVISEKLNLPYVESQPYSVVLSVNVPLLDFKQKEREEYVKLYEPGKIFNIKLNGEPVSFKIEKLELFFESQGAILRNQQLIGKQTLVYDIGGKNDTFVLYGRDGKPVTGRNKMAFNGLLKMLGQMGDDLREKYGTEFTIQQIEEMVLGKEEKPEGFETIFNAHATKWVKRFKSEILKLDDVNTVLTSILFTGGGSLALQKQLQQEFSEYKNVYFSNDAKYDNAHGGLIRALNIHAK